MKTSEVLRRAKRHLSPNGINTGICEAVSDVWVPYRYKNRVKDMITARIYPWIYAHYWLGHAMSGGKTVDHITTPDFQKAHRWVREQSPKDIQAWRHAWVDQMIAEFEAKGD